MDAHAATTSTTRLLRSPRTGLIGRERERQFALTVLVRPDIACLTLTGPGGVGKTRLAQDVMSAALRAPDTAFPDGGWAVELAAVSGAEAVIPWVARSLGVQEASESPTLDGLAAFLSGRNALLFLDNVEHVIGAAPALAELLTRCSGLKILATSRRPLRIAGEQELPLDPLPLSAADANDADSPAVRLFFERAQAVRPETPIDVQTRALAGEICRRVDGLPLAIELAAARVKSRSLGALAHDVQRRLGALSPGKRDAPDRQQTMRATIAWSYDLLSPEQAKLFRRLSIFAGVFSVEDALAVADGDEVSDQPWTAESLIDALAELVEQSLLRPTGEPTDDETRYVLLETIRAFGREELARRGELDRLRARHAAYFRSLAEAADPQLMGPQQGAWLDRLELDHPEYIAAMETFLTAGSAVDAFALGTALWRFWSLRGHSREGLEWMRRAHALDGDASPDLRARALRAHAHLAEDLGDFAEAIECHRDALAIWRELGDLINVSKSLSYLGCCAHDQGEFEQAGTLHAEALAFAHQADDPRSIALALTNFGTAAFRQGDMRLAIDYWEAAIVVQGFDDPGTTALQKANIGSAARQLGDLERAARMANESLAIYRTVGDQRGIATALLNVADLRVAAGELVAAETDLREALELFRRTGMPYGEICALVNLADVTQTRGHHPAALDHLRDGISLALRQGFRVETADLLEAVAAEAVRLGAPRDGARLWAVAHTIRDETGAFGGEVERAERERIQRELQAALDPVVLAAASAEGHGLSPRQAASDALALIDRLMPLAVATEGTPAPPADSTPAMSFGLTARELDVLRQLVDGRSDREIADALFISPKTASTHVSNILGKLGVESRTAAATLAVRSGLA